MSLEMNQRFNKNDKHCHENYNNWNNVSLSYQQLTSRFNPQPTHQMMQEPEHRYLQCHKTVSNECNPHCPESSVWNEFNKKPEERVNHHNNRENYSQYSYESEVKYESQSTKKQIYGDYQPTDLPGSGFQDTKQFGNNLLPASYGNQQINILRTNFSNIILYLGSNPKSKLPMLKKSFAESPYGQLDRALQRFGNIVTVNLTCAGQCLAEGTAKSAKEATMIASSVLFEKLQAINYVIVENCSYFTKSKVPNCALNVDSSLRHIYRVVYLECKYQSNFPFSVTGAVEYVQTEDGLWKYLENHCRNHKKIDLFILNIEKSLRRKVSEICKIHNMSCEPINGCSDRGAIARALLDLPSLFHELKECGGQNIKHRLIPPGQPIGNEFGISVIKTEGSENDGAKTDNCGISFTCKQDVFEDDKAIVISPWIADNLIIMDLFMNKNSTKETPKEILFCSVRECKAFNEFVIEKTRDRLSGRITGSALIDRKLVGGATAFTEDTVKLLAAQNALQNLKKYCYYVEGKSSYFGNYGSKPAFLYWNATRVSSTIYKIMDQMEVITDQDLHREIRQFKSSRFQDLFLLDNISDKIRNLAVSIGLELKLQVRFFEGGICIYKKQRPREVLKELLSLENCENEKYKLHYPQMKNSSEGSSAKNGDNCDTGVQNLFDFKSVLSHEPINRNKPKTNNQTNQKDYHTSTFRNLFDFQTEQLHGPVNYNLPSKGEEQFNESDRCLQNNQAIKREPDGYVNGFQTKSNQLFQRSDFREELKDHYKRFRVN